jgi:DNA-binding GntR family transcriptional regulator
MEPRLAPRARPHSISDQVREVLKETLASGGLEVGQVYPIQTLADQMGVSRTPVREALLQMQQSGLVRILPNQGVLILGRTVEDLRQVFQIRTWLEVPAVREAVARADADAIERLRAAYARLEALAEAGDRAGVEAEDRAFHALLLEAAGNQRLADVVGHLRDFLISNGYASTGHERSLRDLALEHRPIVEAVAAGDADAAAAAMEAHLARTAEVTIELATARAAAAADDVSGS